MECPICYENIVSNELFNLECCNKIVHKYCLDNWIISNINNNKEIHLCIFCKKNNDYINNIIYYTKLEEETNSCSESDNNSIIEIQESDSDIYIRNCNWCNFIYRKLFC